MTRLPDFRAGQSLRDFKEEELRSLVDAVRNLLDWMETTKRLHLPDLARLKKRVDETAERQIVVIRSMVADTDLYVNVQRVEPTVFEGTWTGLYEPSGPVVKMAVYPLQEASDYAAFLWPEERDPMTRETCVLPAMRIEGVWYVEQYLRHRLAPPDVNVPITDCAVSVLES